MDIAKPEQTSVNDSGTSAGFDTPLTQPCSLAVHARDLRRIRPSISDLGARSKVGLLIGQCDNWETGNQAEMRPRMEDNIQAIERALRQGE